MKLLFFGMFIKCQEQMYISISGLSRVHISEIISNLLQITLPAYLILLQGIDCIHQFFPFFSWYRSTFTSNAFYWMPVEFLPKS